jgi:hypothetical protein
MVVMVSTMNQFAQDVFEKEAGVLPLPFILSSEPVGPEIAKHLVKHGVIATHKTYEAAALIAKTHSQFAFSQF